MFGSWETLPRRMGMAVLIIGTALPMAPEAWGYQSCTPALADAPANNVATTGDGEVNNLADELQGVDLPGGGVVVGPSSMPPPDEIGVYKSVKWGTVSWQEPTRSCKGSQQNFDFWPPAAYQEVPDGVVYPTIVYFHPNGATQHFEANSTLMANLAQPAHDLGLHFISVEFRHPVADEYLADAPNNPGHLVPHGDAGLFIQWLRDHAAQLKVDTRNLFVFGHSRGALALWQALQPNVQGQTSTQVTGFVGFQGQTSYGCDVFSNRYLVQDSSTASYVADCRSGHVSQGGVDHNAQFGDAVASVHGGLVNPTKLPVMLQYEKAFYLQSGSQTQIKPITVADMTALYSDLAHGDDGSLHYPNFGMALYNRYVSEGINAGSPPLMDRPKDLISNENQFKGWQAFVTKWLVR
jgi:hypothetical protein